MPFHVHTGDTLVHGENLIGCVPSPLMGEGQGEGEKSEAPSTVPLTPAPARGEGEKSVVSYQTYKQYAIHDQRKCRVVNYIYRSPDTVVPMRSAYFVLRNADYVYSLPDTF